MKFANTSNYFNEVRSYKYTSNFIFISYFLIIVYHSDTSRYHNFQGHMMTQHNVETGGSPPGPISRGLLGGLMLGDSPLVRSPSRPLPFPTPKLACIYCTKDSFTTMEALQLHVQAMHGE